MIGKEKRLSFLFYPFIQCVKTGKHLKKVRKFANKPIMSECVKSIQNFHLKIRLKDYLTLCIKHYKEIKLNFNYLLDVINSSLFLSLPSHCNCNIFKLLSTFTRFPRDRNNSLDHLKTFLFLIKKTLGVNEMFFARKRTWKENVEHAIKTLKDRKKDQKENLYLSNFFLFLIVINLLFG